MNNNFINIKHHMKFIKPAVAAALSLAMLFSFACTPKDEPKDPANSSTVVPTESDSPNQTSSSPTPTEKKGRYIEEALDFPEAGMQYFNDVVVNTRNALELYTAEGIFSSSDLKTWTKLDAPWYYTDMISMEDPGKTETVPLQIRQIAYGKDGTLYVLHDVYEGSRAKPVLAKLDASGSILEEIAVEWHVLNHSSEPAKKADFSAEPPHLAYDSPSEDDSNAVLAFGQVAQNTATSESESSSEEESVNYYERVPMPSGLAIADNGDILIGDHSQGVIHYSSDGSYKDSYNGGESFMVVGNKLWMSSLSGENTESYYSVFSIDLSSGESNEISVPEASKREAYNIRFGNLGSEIYIGTAAGVFKLNGDMQTWELIVDGSISSLASPNNYIQDFLAVAEDKFLFSISGTGITSLLCFTYDPNSPEPSVELRVYSLYDNQSARIAANEFMKLHPEVKVVCESSYAEGEYDSEFAPDDMIRALSSELSNGQGPDIIIMDDLPIGEYLEKNYLLDISEVISPMVESGSLLKNVASFTQKDGSYYAIPAFFSYPYIIGHQNDIARINSLKDLSDFALETPARKAFFNMQAKNLFYRFFYPSSSYFISDDGTIIKETFVEFLNEIKRLANSSLPAQDENGSSDEAAQFDSDMLPSPDILDDMSESDGISSIIDGETSFAYGQVNSLWTLEYISAIKRELGDGANKALPGMDGSVYYPSDIFSINANSGQADLAKEFVKLLLSDDFQGSELLSGLPTNFSALKPRYTQAQIAEGNLSMGIGLSNGRILEIDYLEQSDIDIARTICESLDKGILQYDAEDISMIYDACDLFFSGSASAEEVANTVAIQFTDVD